MGCGSPEKTRLPPCPDREWTRRAVTMLQGDGRRSADTHLVNPIFPGLNGISIYLKDESTHPTGSLKHRLARSLFLYGICNGRIREGTTLVEASSDRLFRRVGGSTGTNFFALCWVAANMIEAGEEGSLVSLICDSGERYSATYYNDAWLDSNDIKLNAAGFPRHRPLPP